MNNQQLCNHKIRAGATKKSAKSKRSSFGSVKNLIPSIPNWGSLTIGLFLGVISTSVVFFYFSTSDITLKIPANATRATTTNNKVAAKKAAVQEETTIAAKQAPEPRFDFYTELTKNSHETTPQKAAKSSVLDLKSAPVPINKYLVQAGSFKHRSDADALKAKLTLNGLDPKIQMARLDNGELWHRVVIGPFKSEAMAAEQKLLLSSLDLHDVLIVRSN